LWQVKVRDGSKDWGWCVVASEVKKAIRKKESLFFGRSFSFKGEPFSARLDCVGVC
jgi:hypothetical protein